jgi:arsenate reductase-like glutaredoxin family protein
MSKKITVYSLEGCSRCNALIAALKDKNLNFKEVSCKDCPECCDSVEDFLNTLNYPICKVELENSECYYFYIATDHKDLILSKIFDNSIKKGSLNITDMFYNIENL